MVFSDIVLAQEQTPLDTVIVFIHKTKDKQKFIKQNKKIIVWTENKNGRIKGKISKINENSFVIDGIEYQFDSIQKIGAKSTGLKIVQTTGKVLLISGILVTGYGAYMVYYGYSLLESDACVAFVSVMIGFIVMAAGIPVAIIGAIPLAIVGHRFNLQKKWDIKMEVIPDKEYVRQQKKLNRKNK